MVVSPEQNGNSLTLLTAPQRVVVLDCNAADDLLPRALSAGRSREASGTYQRSLEAPCRHE